MSAPFFKKSRRSGPVLSHQQSARQGSAVRFAAAALPDKDAVRAFLNTYHSELLGRPIDLAVASDAGLDAVLSALGSGQASRSTGASA